MNRIPINSITPDFLDKWVIELTKRPKRHTRFSYEKEISFLKGLFSFYREHASVHFDIPIRNRHYKKAFVKEKPFVDKALLEADFIKFRDELANLKHGELYST